MEVNPNSPLHTQFDLKNEQLKKLSENEVIIAEGEVKTAKKDQTILYPEISSCLSVTIALEDGTLLGTHLVAVPGDKKNCTQCLTEMKALISEKNPAKKLFVVGSLGEPWESPKTFIPAVTGAAVEFKNIDTTAGLLALYFNCPDAVLAGVKGSADVSISNGEVFASSTGQNMPISLDPKNVFGQGMDFEDMVDFFTLP